MADLIGALDQGTTSTRFMVFDHWRRRRRRPARASPDLPPPGWVEHDPAEIWTNAIGDRRGPRPGRLEALRPGGIGLTNQRETTVIWDRSTGSPCPTPSSGRTRALPTSAPSSPGMRAPDRFRAKTGLPLATYFSGPKVRQLLDELDLQRCGRTGRARLRDDRLLDGLEPHRRARWRATHHRCHQCLPNPAHGPGHHDLGRRPEPEIGVPSAMLPEIVPSIGVGSVCVGALEGVPLAAILGDQQAAWLDRCASTPGTRRTRMGRGISCCSTPAKALSHRRRVAHHGRLPTSAARCRCLPWKAPLRLPARWSSGCGTTWALRDRCRHRGYGDRPSRTTATSIWSLRSPGFSPPTGGRMPGAWSPGSPGSPPRATSPGLRWNRSAFQTRDVLDAMVADSGVRLSELRVDGGMTANALLMQFQADILGVGCDPAQVAETTALGAALAPVSPLGSGVTGTRSGAFGRRTPGGHRR